MLAPEIELAFGDGDYLCALRLPQIVELEQKCGYTDTQGNRRKRGIVAIYADVIAGLAVVDGQVIAVPQSGLASAADCREVVLQALVGGGRGVVNGQEVQVSPVRARQLVEAYLDTQPIVAWWTTAAAILRAALEGFDPKKKAGRAAVVRPKRRSTRGKSSSTAG